MTLPGYQSQALRPNEAWSLTHPEAGMHHQFCLFIKRKLKIQPDLDRTGIRSVWIPPLLWSAVLYWVVILLQPDSTAPPPPPRGEQELPLCVLEAEWKMVNIEEDIILWGEKVC